MALAACSTSSGPPPGGASFDGATNLDFDSGGTEPDASTPDAGQDATSPGDSTAPLDSGSPAQGDTGSIDAPVDTGSIDDGGPADAGLHEAGSDGGSQVVVLASNQSSPLALTVDSNSVYWVSSAGVLSAPLAGVPDGGTPTTLYSGTGASAIAVDSQDVYWSSASGLAQGVFRTPLTGGGTVTTIGYGNTTIWMTIDANNVYWIDLGDGTVMRAPKADGGTAVTLATVGASPQCEGIAVGPSGVFWTESLQDTVMSLPFDGGAMSTISAGSPRPYRIAVGASGVYWTTGAAPAPLMMAPLTGVADGGAGTVLANSGTNSAADIALDATNVYWTDPNEGLVLSVPQAGGALTTIASGQPSPYGIAVDASYVYWTNLSGGTIAKAPKN